MDTTTSGRFRYHGSGGDLFGLVLVNALLSIITFGIYSFWAKTKVREFHYSHTEFDGDRFAYHGRGGELLKGALVAFGILVAAAIVYGVAFAVLGGDSASPLAEGLLTAVFYLALIPLIAFAINGARRYRLTRSSWRGIRFSYHGDPNEFIAMMFKGILLSILSLGVYIPFFQSDRRAFLVNNTRFGSEPFIYDGEGRGLFFEFIKAVLLTIPTLGFCWIWYAAFKHRYFWEHTRMRGARFEAPVRGGELFELQIVNMLLAWFTLGIGVPWVITRTHSFFCERLAIVGIVDWARIRQEAQAATATSEGLAEGFDVDVGIG
jgi:uncharacterized membrane protein YjgN (DUF898 family)